MEAQICKNCKYKHDGCSFPNKNCDKYKPAKMVIKKSWEEFRDNGL